LEYIATALLWQYSAGLLLLISIALAILTALHLPVLG